MDFVGIDKLSLLDYEDKVSCVLFSKACNFRCPFCHNGLSVLNSNESISMDEIKKYLSSRKGIIDAVVVSGGEPTLMPDLIDKIKEFKSMGFLIKLDTNGTHPDVLKELIDAKLVDYVAMDIKNCEEKYSLTVNTSFTQMDNIKASIKLLINSGISYEFRTTLVKEFHSLEDVNKMGELIKGSKKLYLQKFIDRDGCIRKGLHEIDESLANKFKEILLNYVDEVNLRGY